MYKILEKYGPMLHGYTNFMVDYWCKQRAFDSPKHVEIVVKLIKAVSFDKENAKSFFDRICDTLEEKPILFKLRIWDRFLLHIAFHALPSSEKRDLLLRQTTPTTFTIKKD